MTGLQVGDRVTDPHRIRGLHRFGIVEHVGPCGWPGCRFGDQCVTIRFNGGITTENRSAECLERA